MSIPVTPPGGPRPDPGAGAGPARVDVAAVSRVLIREVRTAAVLALGEAASALPAPAPGESPAATAAALGAWLGTVSGAAVPPAAAAPILAAGYASALEVLAHGAAANPGSAGLARTLHDLVAGALGGRSAPPSAATATDALEILSAAVERAVSAELGAVPAPPPAAEAAVTTALLAWVRAQAAARGLPVAALAAAVESGIEHAALVLAAAEPAVHAGFARAKDVLLAGVGSDATVPLLPFRPDFGLPPGAIRRAAGRALPAPREELEPEPDGEADPAGPDLQGPMELIRRYFEDFHAATPAAIALHFVLPAGFYADGRWSGHAERAALEHGIAERRATLRARGITGGRILMLRVEPLADRVATVFALMTRDAADGAVVEEVEYAYTTVRVRAGWRIAVSVRRR